VRGRSFGHASGNSRPNSSRATRLATRSQWPLPRSS
jgi:hypothetical protein